MALPPLATIQDLAIRGLAASDGEVEAFSVFLDVVSTAVREAAGVPISLATSTIALEGERGQRLRLPGLPIVSVSEVLLDGEPVTDFLLRSQTLWRGRGWTHVYRPSEVEVTYTHGLAEVPSDIVDLVCRLTAAAVTSYRAEPDGSGMAAADIRAERIGDYSVTFGSAGLITDVELPDYLRERLQARFGGGAYLLKSR